VPIPDPRSVSVSEARKRFSELVADVERGDGLRVVVERKGKPLAILVHPEELRTLDHRAQLASEQARKPGAGGDATKPLKVRGEETFAEVVWPPVKGKRVTYRSAAAKQVYAKRDAKGRVTDVRMSPAAEVSPPAARKPAAKKRG
jgi:prevent-host-death family protein